MPLSTINKFPRQSLSLSIPPPSPLPLSPRRPILIVADLFARYLNVIYSSLILLSESSAINESLREKHLALQDDTRAYLAIRKYVASTLEGGGRIAFETVGYASNSLQVHYGGRQVLAHVMSSLST